MSHLISLLGCLPICQRGHKQEELMRSCQCDFILEKIETVCSLSVGCVQSVWALKPHSGTVVQFYLSFCHDQIVTYVIRCSEIDSYNCHVILRQSFFLLTWCTFATGCMCCFVGLCVQQTIAKIEASDGG